MLKSLLDSCIIVLSFFNALYSGMLSVVLIWDLSCLQHNHLLRPWGKGEAFSEEYAMLLHWLCDYYKAIFAVRQLAWPVLYMHGYIAWVFFSITRGKRPLTAIQRGFPLAILGIISMAGLSSGLETYAYLTGYCPHISVDVVFSSACLLFVVAAYVGTCVTILHRTKGNNETRASFHVIRARNRTIGKLLLILAVFILVWTWVVANAVRYHLSGETTAVDVPSAMMSILDSLILGNVLGIG